MSTPQAHTCIILSAQTNTRQQLSDCMVFAARILRAIRIAARLGFRFSRETAHFVKHLSLSVLKLDRVCVNNSFLTIYNYRCFLSTLKCFLLADNLLQMS